MKIQGDTLVMALYPNARGFAYVIFEGPSPVDWGISDVPRKKKRLETYVRRLSRLVDRYHPDVLLLRGKSEGTQPPTVRTTVEIIEALAGEWDLPTRWVSRKEVQQKFAHLGSPTRYAIAASIARSVPLFAPLMPPARKIWNGEDRRMGLFDAVALALTHLDDGFSALAS